MPAAAAKRGRDGGETALQLAKRIKGNQAGPCLHAGKINMGLCSAACRASVLQEVMTKVTKLAEKLKDTPEDIR